MSVYVKYVGPTVIFVVFADPGLHKENIWNYNMKVVQAVHHRQFLS